MSVILVIDDDDDFRYVICEMLRRAGHEVSSAIDGVAGIKHYREKKPELIITDVLMPEKTGAEVVFELEKEFPDVKIIAISGGGQGDARDYLDSIKAYSKVKYTLQKPFPMDDLLKTVKEALEG